MITANFEGYASYTVDSLYQWDIDRTLAIAGLTLNKRPEIPTSPVSDTNTNVGVVIHTIPETVGTPIINAREASDLSVTIRPSESYVRKVCPDSVIKITKGSREIRLITGSTTTRMTVWFLVEPEETGATGPTGPAGDNATTTSVATTSENGLLPKLDGDVTKFLRADGKWQIPPDSKVAFSILNPETLVGYYLPFKQGPSSNADILNINNGIRYWSQQGTESSIGSACLSLGNNISSDTEGNKEGSIWLYSSNVGGRYLKQTDTTSTINHTLPAVNGTILNTGTTSYTASTSSSSANAYKIGTFKINGISTDIYGSYIDTDKNVRQIKTTETTFRPILLTYQYGDDIMNATEDTNQACYSSKIYVNPRAGILYSESIIAQFIKAQFNNIGNIISSRTSTEGTAAINV